MSDQHKLEILLTAKDITGKAFTNVKSNINSLTKSVFSLNGALVGLGVGFAGKKIAGDFLEVASSFEAMEAQLDILYKGQGREVLEDLNQWALDMPINTEKAVQGFVKMSAMGLNPTIDTLETLTDVASIFGDDVLGRLTLQLGQMASKEKVMAQDLNIMAEAGINARKYIKDAYGMTVEEIQNSSIDIKDIIKTLFEGMEKDFGGSAKKMMGTWRGLKTVTRSYFVEIEREIMAAGIFDELKSGLSDFNDEMKTWLGDNRELIQQKVPEYIEDIKKAVGGIYDLFTENKEVLEYGAIGYFLYGKKGALAGAGLGYTVKNVNDLAAALALAAVGHVDLKTALMDTQSVVKDFRDLTLAADAESIDTKIAVYQSKIKDLKQENLEKPKRKWYVSPEKYDLDLFFKRKKNLDDISKFEQKIEGLRLQRKAAMYKKSEDMAKDNAKKEKDIEKKKAADIQKAKMEALYKAKGGVEDPEKKLLKEKEEALKLFDAFRIKNLDKSGKEYQDLVIDQEMKKWKAVKGITKEQLDEINILIVQGFPEEVKKKTEDTFKDIGKNFTEEIQSEFGSVFSDLLRDDLDSFEDYFSSFTESLSSMWGSTMSKITMESMTEGGFTGLSGIGLGAGASLGVMGAIGVGLAGVSYALDKRKEEKAEEERRLKIRESLESQLGDELARLKLGDAEYSLYKLNEKIEDLTKSAIDAGYPLEKIIELRNLETEEIMKQSRERYEDLSESMTGWVTGIQRQDWGVSDFENEFNRLTDEFMSLDDNAKNYQDDSLSLLNDQFEILQEIRTIQESQLSALSGTSKSLETQIWNLTHAETMPFSPTEFEAQYERLLGLTTTEEGKLDPAAIADFQAFADRFIKEMSAFGDDTGELTAGVVEDLIGLKGEVDSEMERLRKAIVVNTTETGDSTDAIKYLSYLTELGAYKEEKKVWTASVDAFTSDEFKDSLGALEFYFDSLDSYVKAQVELYQESPELYVGPKTAEGFGAMFVQELQPYADETKALLTAYAETLLAKPEAPVDPRALTPPGGILPTVDIPTPDYTSMPYDYNQFMGIDYSAITQAIISGVFNDPKMTQEVSKAGQDVNINIEVPVNIDSDEIGRIMVRQKYSNSEVAENFN